MTKSIIINLDRRFYRARAKEKEEAAQNSYLTGFLSGENSGEDLGWLDLLKSRIVVILGEPGSGKTTEFRFQSENLRAEGKNVFYIELGQLAHESFEASVDVKHKIFLQWKKSNELGYFFLDAVDEAKLRNPSDFFRAINKVARAVEDFNFGRTHLVLSSRISEWQPETDLNQVRKSFILQSDLAAPVNNKSENAQDDVLVVHIAPLDPKRVRTYAESRGIENVESFINALNEHHAWEFARRPWDVNALIEYWKRFNCLGTLTELIEENVKSGLQEKRDIGALSPESALEGAKSMAAAATFCQHLNFRISDANHIQESSSLNPIDCLPSVWNPTQSRALLNRAIFDGATYGCIRFHHRREQEYLTASWLNAIMENGCPLDRLIDLLFFTHKGQYILRPYLVPITAWVANGEKPHNIYVRDLILKSSPEIHFKYGDPAQLPINYKRELLYNLCRKYQNRKNAWIDSESQALARLAEVALARDASKIILDQTVSSDFRSEILQIARYGKLNECRDAAFEILNNPAEGKSLKFYAAAMLRDSGDALVQDKLAEYVRRQTVIDPGLASIFCQALYPSVINAKALAELLQKSVPIKRTNYDFPWSLKDHLKNNLSTKQAMPLLAALMGLVETPPLINSGYQVPISKEFVWLCDLFPGVLVRALQETTISDENADMVAQCIHLLEDHWRQNSYSDETTLKEIPQILSKQQSVRRAYFWKAVEQYRLRNKGEPRWLGQVFGWNQIQLITPEKDDIDWLKRDSVDKPNFIDRVLAMQSALEIWKPYKFQMVKWVGLLIVGMQSEGLRKSFWRQTWVQMVSPLTGFWVRQISWKLLSKIWWERKFSRIRSAKQWLRDQYVLHRRLRYLYTGQDTWNLAFLLRDGDGSHFHYTKKDWSKFGRRRGPFIAWAARHGCEVSWLSHNPLLPHEKPVPNETDRRVILGLCGLQSLWLRGTLKFSNLSAKDAHRAARYALSDLNEFTDWLPDLANEQPSAVREVFLLCIQGEWRFDHEHKHVNAVLSKLLWGGEFYWPLIINDILDKLKEEDPLNSQILVYSLSILLKSCTPSQLMEIKELIPTRITEYKTESQSFVNWLAVWLELDAGRGTAFLETHLAGLDRKSADDLMVWLCSTLQGERGFSRPVPNPDYLTPQALSLFLPIVARHIRVEEDIDRLGGEAYSPGPRDHAQEFRGALISYLVNNPSSDSHEILERIQTIPEMSILSERIEHLARESLAKRGNLPPWAPKDILSFSIEYEVEPKNEEGLFTVAFDRIRDIATEVERSENSPRSEVQLEWKEVELRSWFQRKLRSRSRGRYTIPQEAEIDLGKRPDLRFEHPTISAIPVEIKWAEKWSTKELLERLEVQLVGQYLRAESVHFGIFLLGRIDASHQWNHPDDHRRIEFEELLKILRDKAYELESKKGVYGVRVMGVDFSIPSIGGGEQKTVRKDKFLGRKKAS